MLSQNFSFWESNLKIRSFVRLKAGNIARACPKTVRVSVQSISFGTGSKLKFFVGVVENMR
jgi:hypothetical protein